MNKLLYGFLAIIFSCSVFFIFEEVALAQNDVISLPLNCTVYDTVMHATESIVYVSDSTNKKLYSIDYNTSEIKELTFSTTPGNITFANNEIYVCLNKGNGTGTIAIVNADSFSLVDQFDITTIPYDIALGKDGYIYISDNYKVKSFSRTTKLQISSVGYDSYCNLELHPISNSLYYTSSSSPADIHKIVYANGQFTTEYDSIYHGDYALTKLNRISPDGNYIFNGSGNIFTSSDVKDNDIRFYKSLNKSFNDVCFDTLNNRFYTGLVDSKQIYSYNLETFEGIGTYTTAGYVKYTYFRDSKIVAISKNDSNQYLVETIDPTVVEQIDKGNPVSSDLTKTGDVLQLNCKNITDLVYHSTSPFLYTVDSTNQEIYKIDTQNAKEIMLKTDYKPTSLAIYNGELYVGFRNDKLIIIYDEHTLEAKERILAISNFFDFTVGKDGYIYTLDSSYSRTTKQQVDSIASLYDGKIEHHPLSNSLYYKSLNVSPADIIKIVYDNGQYITAYDSSYHGDYTLGNTVRISPDGKFIFNSSGNIFTSSDIKENDIKFYFDLGISFNDISFDLGNNKFYTGKGKQIISHNYETLEGTGKYTTIGNVEYMDFKNSKVVAISKNDNNQYLIETIAPNSFEQIAPEFPDTSSLSRTGNTINLNCKDITKAIYHPSSSDIYAIDSTNNEIYRIDTQNNIEIKVKTYFKPESLAYYNDELYVGFENQGMIKIFDAKTLEEKDKIILFTKFYDMTVGNDGFIYTLYKDNARSFSRTTKQQVSGIANFYNGNIELHPLSNAFYFTSSSAYIYKFVYHNGHFTTTYSSSYYSGYSFGNMNRISPDGKFIFNSSGNILTSSDTKENDMKFHFNLGIPFNDISFDLENKKFYTGIDGKQIISHDYETFEGTERYTTTGNVKYINFRNSKIVAISKTDNNQYLIETIDSNSFEKIVTGIPAASSLSRTGNTINLNCKDIIKVIYHPTSPAIYAIDSTNNEIYRIDTQNNKEIKVKTYFKPESLAYYNDELYVGFGNQGLIKIFDAQTLEEKDHFIIFAKFYDMTVGNDGYIYTLNRDYARSFSRVTKQQVSKYSCGNKGKLELHPLSNSLYFTRVDAIPKDIHKIVYQNGQFTTAYESIYHGDYLLDNMNRISPDGKYIFNSSGNIFTSSDTQANDILYYNKLKKPFIDIAFDITNNRIFSYSQSEKFLRVFDYNNFNTLGIINISGDVQFINLKNEIIKAIVKENNEYSIEVVPTSLFIPLEIEEFNLNISDSTLALNTTLQLSPTLVFNDESVENITLQTKYLSSNTDVITINSAGLLKAVNYGNALITVQYENLTKTINFKVLPTLSNITVLNGALTTSFNKQVTEYAVIIPFGTTTIPEITAIKTDGNTYMEIQKASSLSENTIIRVIAPDNVTINTYMISFTQGFESSHPYANNIDKVWIYESQNPVGSISMTFSKKTTFEEGYDYIYITDCDGNDINGSPFTGNSLAGKTLTIMGDKVFIRLKSDEYVNDFGFQVFNFEETNLSIDQDFIVSEVLVTDSNNLKIGKLPDSGVVNLSTKIKNISTAEQEVNMYIASYDVNNKLQSVNIINKKISSNEYEEFSNSIDIGITIKYIKVFIFKKDALSPIILPIVTNK